MLVRPAVFTEHKAIMNIAKLSKYTRDFSNMMFSGEAAYEKKWINVAVDDLSYLGFYCVRHKVRTPSTTLYFIGVEPYRKAGGIGQSLLNHLIENSPHPRVELNCMKDNLEALKFYECNGFEIVGEGLKGAGWHLVWETKNADSNTGNFGER